MQFNRIFIEVDEDTRINVKLKTGQETEINAPGPHITSTQFEQLLQQIKKYNKRRYSYCCWKCTK